MLERADVVAVKEQLVAWHAKGTRVGSSCVGTFILADAGLLDGREATTNWALAPLFRHRYPKVRLNEKRMLVPSGRVVTTGAAMGHLDLALWLIRQVSPTLSDTASRYLIADLRLSQAPYVIPTHLAQTEPQIQRFEQWAQERLKEGFDLKAAAKALGTSPRTLQRRCVEVLGKSPLSFFQDLRVERARSLLHEGRDIEAIAVEVGYDDGATLRSLLRRRLGRGVRELRADMR
jgi:transcriptional regulator GlxA family with amidase domain